MDALTINEAATTTGWSPRMLRYIEGDGLISPPRSASDYRLYRPEELQRLRTLRELLAEHDLSLGDVGFARRMRRDAELRAAVNAWLEAPAARPAGIASGDWLSFEQAKHTELLAAAANSTTN
ncbi:MAG: MerR family transcriptional regulator [Solirubrobacterales bacterium]|nr:MerR family transcriptional regulator [Solirubrobacterales bacterium]